MKLVIYRAKRPKHLKELSFRCHKELQRKLRLALEFERYRSFGHIVEDYCASILGIVNKKSDFNLYAHAEFVGRPGSQNWALSRRLHVKIDEEVLDGLRAEADKRGVSVSCLVRLFLRNALSLRWERMHRLGRCILRRRALIDLVVRDKGLSYVRF